MSETIKVIRQWLDRVEARGATHLWIDDGGLCLRTNNDAHYELGGEPSESECIDRGDGDELPSGPLTLEFFERMPKGTEIRLYYNCFNTGDFLWCHSHVEDGRVYGAFEGGGEWTDVSDYLYEYGGHVCRGSGAEPVHAIEPTESDTHA